MNSRQAKILRHVVIDYVHTIVPVGSKKLTRSVGLSSASIRNAMSQLEKEGYLEKPHHSAGRVPTDRGYRYFVDALIDEYISTDSRTIAAVDSLETIRFTLDRLLEDISGRLSTWSNCLSFISIDEQDRSEIRRLELTPVSSHGMLIILVLGNGMVENKLVETPVDARSLPLDRFTNTINERLCGMRVCDVTDEVLDRIFI